MADAPRTPGPCLCTAHYCHCVVLARRLAEMEAERDRLRAALDHAILLIAGVPDREFAEGREQMLKPLRAALAGTAGAEDGRGGKRSSPPGATSAVGDGGDPSGTARATPPPQSPAPVSGDMRTTYERFRHLDRLLSDPDWVTGSAVAATLRDLWLAVKAEVESRRVAQAPEPGGTAGILPPFVIRRVMPKFGHLELDLYHATNGLDVYDPTRYAAGGNVALHWWALSGEHPEMDVTVTVSVAPHDTPLGPMTPPHDSGSAGGAGEGGEEGLPVTTESSSPPPETPPEGPPAPAPTKPCPDCEGSGRVWADGRAHLPEYRGACMDCPNCDGTGTVPVPPGERGGAQEG